MYGLYDLPSGHRLTEDIEIHFLEIPNFEVKSVREMKRLDRWLAYFSNKLNETETEALAMSEAAIQEAMKAEHVFMQDDIERWQYEQREKAIRDYISGMRSSQREGMKRGMEEGLKQGLKQGIEKTSLQNLKNLMKNMNLTAGQAMEILQIPAADQERYTKLLHQ